jgi:hypothetical protein
MKVRYSTNWMGVANMQWYRDRGLTKKVTKVLENDSIITTRKAGDIVEIEEITEPYSCGRLDFWNPYNDSMFSDELSVPPMRNEDWSSFGDWLDTFETDDVLNLDQLVELYEQTNPKIRWAKE